MSTNCSILQISKSPILSLLRKMSSPLQISITDHQPLPLQISVINHQYFPFADQLIASDNKYIINRYNYDTIACLRPYRLCWSFVFVWFIHWFTIFCTKTACTETGCTMYVIVLIPYLSNMILFIYLQKVVRFQLAPGICLLVRMKISLLSYRLCLRGFLERVIVFLE